MKNYISTVEQLIRSTSTYNRSPCIISLFTWTRFSSLAVAAILTSSSQMYTVSNLILTSNLVRKSKQKHQIKDKGLQLYSGHWSQKYTVSTLILTNQILYGKVNKTSKLKTRVYIDHWSQKYTVSTLILTYQILYCKVNKTSKLKTISILPLKQLIGDMAEILATVVSGHSFQYAVQGLRVLLVPIQYILYSRVYRNLVKLNYSLQQVETAYRNTYQNTKLKKTAFLGLGSVI